LFCRRLTNRTARFLNIAAFSRFTTLRKAPIAKADPEAVYQSGRWAVGRYKVQVPNGTYTITLRFCEFHFDDPGKRVFDIAVEGQTVAERFDAIARAGKNVACDLVLKDVTVEDDALDIELDVVVDHAFIAGISIEGRTAVTNQVAVRSYERHINCDGDALADFEGDLPDSTPVAARDLLADDFYQDWCKAQFGSADPALVELFVPHDGVTGRKEYNKDLTDLPRPAAWGHGPGIIIANSRSWKEEQKNYAFVDELAALRPTIKGAGNLSRFDYWLNNFRYLRAVGKASCTRGALDIAMKSDPDEALALRIELARDWETLMTFLLAVTDTPGAMGTVANLEQHVRRCPDGKGEHAFLTAHDAKLAEFLGKPLPESVNPATRYLGEAHLIVPTVRTSRALGETLLIKAIVLDNDPADRATLHWRTLGGKIKTEELRPVGRGVFEVELPATGNATVEYFITAKTADGKSLVWPATAPARGQTVVVMP